MFIRPIVVVVKIMPLVLDKDHDDAVGSGTPSKYYAAKNENGILRMYPKALLKQAEELNPFVGRGSDIEMVFDTNTRCQFDGDLDSHQFSFDCNHL